MTQSLALELLKTGANIFLTGEPGSGKTYTTQAYVSYLRAHGIEIAVTASTGIAATALGGMTVHSWSGIGIHTKLDKRDLDAIARSKHVRSRVKRARTLIIEEISMLSASTLSLVDAVCRRIKESHEPFGGLQVVFVGDFFQLPPIVRHDANDAQMALMKQSLPLFAYDAVAWKAAHPTVCYLTEQHRQDDADYLGILSAIRRTTFDDTHLRALHTRKIEYAQAPEGVPKLFSHNADVDSVNASILGKLPGSGRMYAMSSHGYAPLVASLQKWCLSPAELQLKKGAAVMFTKNNQKDGFVNGTLGVVEGFDNETGYPMVRVRSGRRIRTEPMDWELEENGAVRARITQLPLRLAWAITVHKSQGMSMDEAIIDLSAVFEFGQGYVALSRLRRMAGLYLLGWNEKAFQVHPAVLAQDEHFRAESETAAHEFASKPENENTIQDVQTRKKGTRAYSAWDTEQDEELRELLEGGVSIAQIAKDFSRTEGSIRSRLAKIGLAL